MTNQSMGKQGENLAARHLMSCGHRVLARNLRIGRLGELDLVTQAEDGLTVCFIEVKTRTSGLCGTPAEAVTADKRRRIRRMAEAFLADAARGMMNGTANGMSNGTANGTSNGAASAAMHPALCDGPPVRFDVVEVEVDATGRRARVHHIPDAF